MKLTYKEFKKALEEAIKEANVSGAAGSYLTPRAFKATSGLTRVQRPKRPSHTKLFDFLEEEK